MNFALPPIESPADLAAALGAVAAAVAEGALTPGEACDLSQVAATFIKAIETADFERRLQRSSSTMHRGRKARLDRLIRRAGEGDRAAVERHHLLRAHAAIGAAVRWSLARSGIDPAQVPALVVADEAAAELAASGDPPPPPSAEPPAWVGDLATDPLSRLDDRTRPACGALSRRRADTRSRAGLARRTAGLVHRRRRRIRFYLSANAGCRFAAD